MKKILFLLLLCISFRGFAQTNNSTNTNFPNGLQASKFFNPPYGTNPIAAGILPGSVYYNTSTNKPLYFTGSVWQAYLSEVLAATLYKPLNALTAWVDITGKPTFFSGSYTDLINKPDLSQYYLASNPSSFTTKAQNDALYQAIGTYLTQSTGDSRYVLLGGSYANPTWITSLPYTKLTGTPNIPTNTNQLTNGSGYITGYTETDPIWNAQKANYYLSSNPAGYISSVDTTVYRTVANSLSKAQVQTGLNTKEATITAGTALQYYRGDKSFQTLNTLAVPELTNLYYTDARVAANTTVAGKQAQLNGVGFVKATGSTISYDNSTYYLASNPNGYTSNTGTVTSFGKTDGTGITSSVANPTTTPVYTVAVDTTIIRTVANSRTLAQTQTVLNLKANLSSPVFTGSPQLPSGTSGVTTTAGSNNTALATTSFVTTADNLKANIASPALTGVPTAPTAAAGTNNTQIATTAFVLQSLPGIVEVSTTTQALSINTTYIIHTPSLTTLTLPATNPVVGSLITFIGDGSGMYRIAQNASQYIVAGNATTTVGTAGYVQTNTSNTNITLRYVNVNKWSVTSSSSTPVIN